MNDPQRTPAPTAEQTPSAQHTLRNGVVEHPTPHAQPVGELLDTLQAQAKDAIAEAVADADTTADKTPLLKRMRSEIGSAEVNAKQHDSDAAAHIELEVRCDRDEQGDGGRYAVRAEGHVARGPITTKIPVAVNVDDGDGSLRLDRDEVRDEITKAARATDDESAR